MVAGLDQPPAGEVRLGDRPVTRADPRCAVVFQEPRLFPWLTVERNVAFGARRLPEPPAPDELLALIGKATDALLHQAERRLLSWSDTFR